MNSDGNTISSFELYGILFLSRLIAFLTFSLSLKEIINTGDRPVMMLIFFLISLVMFIPVLLVSCDSSKTGIMAKARSISEPFAKILSVIYALFFLWYASVSEARFDIFASTVLYSQSDITIYIILLTACAVYGAYKGLEALGRASVIFLFFIVFSLVFTIITVSAKFDILNITPPLYDSAIPVISNGFSSATRTVEPLTIMILAPYVKGNIKKGFFWWLFIFFITAQTAFTLIGGVTGKYGDMQLFQLYTLTSLSGFSIFERLDALLSGLWVFCALIKLAFFIYVAVVCIEQGFGVKLKKVPYVVSGVLCFSVSKVLAVSLNVFAKVSSSYLIDASTLVFSMLLPLVVFIIYRIVDSKKQKREAVTC